jgi:hypothetical protein
VALIEAHMNSPPQRKMFQDSNFCHAIDVVFIVSCGGLMDSVPDKNTSLLSVLTLVEQKNEEINKDLSDLHCFTRVTTVEKDLQPC